MAVLDAQGGFDGLVAATLDADYFGTLMASVLYADDMWTAVVHASGAVLAAARRIRAQRG